MDLKRDDHVKLRVRHFHIPRSFGRDKVFRLRNPKGCPMPEVIYEIVEHDGGWAYRVDGVYSEPFPSHDEARRAAERAAKEQVIRGDTTDISYEDKEGRWHDELAKGSDRPETDDEG